MEFNFSNSDSGCPLKGSVSKEPDPPHSISLFLKVPLVTREAELLPGNSWIGKEGANGIPAWANCIPTASVSCSMILLVKPGVGVSLSLPCPSVFCNHLWGLQKSKRFHGHQSQELEHYSGFSHWHPWPVTPTPSHTRSGGGKNTPSEAPAVLVNGSVPNCRGPREPNKLPVKKSTLHGS